MCTTVNKTSKRECSLPCAQLSYRVRCIRMCTHRDVRIHTGTRWCLGRFLTTVEFTLHPSRRTYGRSESLDSPRSVRLFDSFSLRLFSLFASLPVTCVLRMTNYMETPKHLVPSSSPSERTDRDSKSERLARCVSHTAAKQKISTTILACLLETVPRGAWSTVDDSRKHRVYPTFPGIHSRPPIHHPE